MTTRIQELRSVRNPAVQRFREAASGEIPGEVVVDGNKLCAEILQADLPIIAGAWSEKLTKAKNGHDLKRRLEQKAETVFRCTDDVLGRMSALTTHQGVILITEAPRWRSEDLLGGDREALVVAGVGVKDPGNLGAIVRTAEAAGATGFLAAGGADPFRDKAVRGSAGSVLRLPALHGFDEASMVAFAKQHGLQLCVADADSEREYLDVDWKKPTVLALGSEGTGVADSLRAAADVVVRVPIQPPVDSLNVAVTAGVMIYEARRQRR